MSAIDSADFVKLCRDKVNDFIGFVNEAIGERRSRVVLRCMFESDDNDSLVPYYVWVVYQIFADLQGVNIGLTSSNIYIPEQDKFSGYLEVPKDLEGEKFFEVTIND